jgi:hypothetical protein
MMMPSKQVRVIRSERRDVELSFCPRRSARGVWQPAARDRPGHASSRITGCGPDSAIQHLRPIHRRPQQSTSDVASGAAAGFHTEWVSRFAPTEAGRDSPRHASRSKSRREVRGCCGRKFRTVVWMDRVDAARRDLHACLAGWLERDAPAVLERSRCRARLRAQWYCGPAARCAASGSGLSRCARRRRAGGPISSSTAARVAACQPA